MAKPECMTIKPTGRNRKAFEVGSDDYFEGRWPQPHKYTNLELLRHYYLGYEYAVRTHRYWEKKVDESVSVLRAIFRLPAVEEE